MSATFAAIRAANPIERFLADRGVKLRESGKRLVGRCPIHQERNGEAFVVWPESGKWLCSGKCFGEWPRGGDIEDLMVAMSGISRDEARSRLRGNVGELTQIIRAPKTPESIPGPTPENPLFLPYIPTDEDKAYMCQCSERLVLSIDTKGWPSYRGWTKETVRGLALDGYLGYTEKTESVYCSEAGCRIKYHKADGGKGFRSLFGKSWLWRGGLIPNHSIIYITEGVPDAITLLDAGIEADGAAVVALQGASFKLEPWNFLFKGKRVVMATDYDEAGRAAANKIYMALAGTAAEIDQINFKKAA